MEHLHPDVAVEPLNPDDTLQATSQVEAALLASALVEDCRVLWRTTTLGERQLVAYIVSAGPFSAERLQADISPNVPQQLLPHAYVPLSRLPLTGSGLVDDQALAQLPVIDGELAQRWEQEVRSLPDVEDVAVIIQEEDDPEQPLHLSDLLPGWQRGAAHDDHAHDDGTARAEQRRSRPASHRPAISHGNPLHLEPDAPATLTHALQRAARQPLPRGVVCVQPDGSERIQSYAELLAEAQRIAAGLRQLGLRPQDKVIFQFRRNDDFIAAFWGCMLGGFVPAPIAVPPTFAPNQANFLKLCNAWQLLGEPLVLTSEDVAPPLRVLLKEVQFDQVRVETVEEMRRAEPISDPHPSQPDDLALLLLTSGSTGMPKAVMQSHHALLSRSAGTVQMNKLSQDTVSFNWMPLDHVGGIVMYHLRDVYLGCKQIHAPTEFILSDPLRWLERIDRHRVDDTWAPNFAFGLINERAEDLEQHHWDLSSLRFILNGGEAIVAKTARRFVSLLMPYGLPADAMHPAYGMSETCSGVTFSHNFTLDTTSDDDPFVEVGAPIPGISIRIVDAQDQVVEEGITGRLQIRGLTVTSGYYHNPELNQEVFTRDGWFKTGDLAMLRDGRLTITGREKDLIIIHGINYYSHEIEGEVEELDDVERSYTAAVAVRDADSDTDKLAIFFVPVDRDGVDMGALVQHIRTTVVQTIGVTPAYVLPVTKATIPKTEIGKIQRTQLGKRFQEGEFDAIVKETDLLTGNPNTLPNWFFRRVWQRNAIRPQASAKTPQGLLIFADSLGLGEQLARDLERDQTRCIYVEAGSAFTQHDAHHYTINPGAPADYRRLCATLDANGLHVDHALHLWTYGGPSEVATLDELDRAQIPGIYSLLFLVQALNTLPEPSRPTNLTVVSSHLQPVLETDEVSYPSSPLLGMVRMVTQEFPWLACRHVDLELDHSEANSERLRQEINTRSRSREIAYRQGERWSPQLEQVDWSRDGASALPFKRGGLYLVSGGLGGIGGVVARYLLTHYAARLVLVGRTPLTTQDDEDGTSLRHKVTARKQAYQDLTELSNDFIYAVADVDDLPWLREIVNQAETRWGTRLDGVIHLAGTLETRQLADETQHSLAALLRPKVAGSWALHQLLRARPGSLFIHFSSVNAFFGSALFGGYGAANSFQDVFAHHQRTRNGVRSYCFAWSLWDETGMTEGYQMKRQAVARGYRILSPQQGIHSFLAALHHGHPHLLVGLDGTNPQIRTQVASVPCNRNKLIAYFSADTPAAGHRLADLTVHDRFQTPTHCQPVQLAALPRTPDGAIDLDHLGPRAALQLTHDDAEPLPTNGFERQVADIWQQVLVVARVSAGDNFFELGGNSLLAAQCISRLRLVCGVELSLRHFFEAPTLAALADQITALHAIQALRLRDENMQEEFEEDVL